MTPKHLSNEIFWYFSKYYGEWGNGDPGKKWKKNRGHLPPSLQGAPATTQVIRCPLWAYSHDPHSHLPTHASFDPQFYRRKKDCWNRHEWIRLTRWLSLVAFAEHF